MDDLRSWVRRSPVTPGLTLWLVDHLCSTLQPSSCAVAFVGSAGIHELIIDRAHSKGVSISSSSAVEATESDYGCLDEWGGAPLCYSPQRGRPCEPPITIIPKSSNSHSLDQQQLVRVIVKFERWIRCNNTGRIVAIIGNLPKTVATTESSGIINTGSAWPKV